MQDNKSAVWLFVGTLCILGSLIGGTAFAQNAPFFVDTGHTDVVDGVEFEIVPPHLFIKKAFKLRDENLTQSQLLIVREAMPAIASMTQQILRRPSEAQTEMSVSPQPRSIYQDQHIDGTVQLYVQTLKNWQVSKSSIQFSIDYFYSPVRGHVVNFRDSYVFAHNEKGWYFLKHPNSKADGVLVCKKSEEGWMRCDVPPKP